MEALSSYQRIREWNFEDWGFELLDILLEELCNLVVNLIILLSYSTHRFRKLIPLPVGAC